MTWIKLEIHFIVNIFCSFIISTYSLKCYKCAHLEYPSDNTITNVIDSIALHFKDKKDLTCIMASKDATGTETCPSSTDAGIDADVDIRCGYVTGVVTGHMALTGDFKLKVHIRECMHVAKKELDGCHSNSDVSKILTKTLNFVPGLQVKNFDGDLCLCSEDGCEVQGCAEHHYTIPYLGQYGKCIQLGILLALVFAIAGSATVICAVSVCCCHTTPPKQIKPSHSNGTMNRNSLPRHNHNYQRGRYPDSNTLPMHNGDRYGHRSDTLERQVFTVDRYPSHRGSVAERNHYPMNQNTYPPSRPSLQSAGLIPSEHNISSTPKQRNQQY